MYIPTLECIDPYKTIQTSAISLRSIVTLSPFTLKQNTDVIFPCREVFARAVHPPVPAVRPPVALQAGRGEGLEALHIDRGGLHQHQPLPQLDTRGRRHASHALLPATETGTFLVEKKKGYGKRIYSKIFASC